MNYNKKLIILIFFLSSFVLSQELDQDFLSSLPEDIRLDILQKAENKDKELEPFYRYDSSKIDKNNLDTTGIFGEEFFTTYQSTFMPINEPNFDSEYVLDYGDVLKIQLIGQKNSISNYSISRDGSINLPDIGKINLSGLSLENATKLIDAEIKTKYIGTESFVSLESLRDINVLVTGNVFNPGVYTLSGNSGPLQALLMAGGISNYGSYRDITVKRNNKVVHRIDIYDYLIIGNSTTFFRLQSGDLVFVEKTQNLVRVDGAVKRPALYELKYDETLDNAIYYSNGTSPSADTNKIIVTRLEKDGLIEYVQINSLDKLKDFVSRDQDIINIKRHDHRKVKINGAVNNPGEYIISGGAGVLDLVTKAGGYTSNAYPFGGVLINLQAKEINTIANERLYDDLLDILILQSSTSPESTQSLVSITETAENLKNSIPTGRVRAEFDLKKLIQNPKEDIVLQEGDEIIIPELLNQVYVFGQVANEGSAMLQAGKGFEYYIEAQGGLLESANQKAIFVLQPNGVSEKVHKRNNIFMSDKNSEIIIYPGTIIFVPRKLENKYAQRQSLQAYISILGNLGVSLASLSVLKD